MNARSADLQPIPLIAPLQEADSRGELFPNVAAHTFAIEIGPAVTRFARFDSAGRNVSPIVSATTPSYRSELTARDDGRGVRLGDRSEAIRAALFDLLRAHARELFGTEDPGAIIVAYPGPVTADGIARRSPALFGPSSDRQDDIRSALGALWPRSHIQVLNQLTCAGYHYVQRGHRDFCIVTVDDNTVGTKVFLDGKPMIGANGYGGEIGQLKASLQPGTPVADNAHRELGQIASGRGIVWLSQAWARGAGNEPAAVTMQAADTSSARDSLIAAFRDGEVQTRHVVRAAAHPLAVVMSALHLGLGLPKFFVVGEFAKALGPAYRAILASWCRELSGSVGQSWDRMIELGEDSVAEALSGAAHLGTRRSSEPAGR